MLKIATQDPAGVKAAVEYALHQTGVSCELREVAQDALYYEMSWSASAADPEKRARLRDIPHRARNP